DPVSDVHRGLTASQSLISASMDANSATTSSSIRKSDMARLLQRLEQPQALRDRQERAGAHQGRIKTPATRGRRSRARCARAMLFLRLRHGAPHEACALRCRGPCDGSRMSERPNPDELLARIRADEELAQRAKLKIFFGAAAGVGKTYAMLVEAHERKRSGVDVVAGWVETHGRSETAGLLDGLEVLPRGTVTYRDTRIDEFDLDAALARRPQLLILDELAHTNAPGSRHRNRLPDAHHP